MCTHSSRTRFLTHKTEQAKNEDASVGERAGAAKDAVGDKAGELKHVCIVLIQPHGGIKLTVIEVLSTCCRFRPEIDTGS